jgi:O-acetyl-ADP-ribose deacetylase
MEKVEVVKGDITQMAADVIVNAANPSLMGGGGVDGAIHRAAGPQILEECKQILAEQGPCETGNAVLTSAGELSAKFIIHTVGPDWKTDKNQGEEKLSECYRNSLQLALENGCKTIAFPNISTGIYGFPKNLAAKIAISTVKYCLQQHGEFEKIYFVCYDFENYDLMQKELAAASKPESMSF